MTVEERLARLETAVSKLDTAASLNDQLSGYYTSIFSGEEIDAAIAKVRSGAVGGVSSFNSRTGAVLPQTGDYTAAMVGAAPSGYGLGTTAAKAPTVNDLDSIVQTGWYAGVPVMPDFLFGNTAVMHVALSLNYATQIAFLYLATSATPKNSLLVRAKEGGVWGTWEWVNPPMQLGVEYRTTERYNKKPVYAKLVNFGKLPNSTSATVSHGSGNVLTVISGNLVNQDGTLLNRYDAITQFTIGRTDIVVRTTVDMSSNICTVNMKYIKTTD